MLISESASDYSPYPDDGPVYVIIASSLYATCANLRHRQNCYYSPLSSPLSLRLLRSSRRNAVALADGSCCLHERRASITCMPLLLVASCVMQTLLWRLLCVY